MTSHALRRLAVLSSLSFATGLSAVAQAHNLDQQSYAQLKSQTKNFAHARSNNRNTQPAVVRLNGRLPDFTARDVFGKEYTRDSFKGQLPVFLLADTQCPCVKAVEGRLKDLAKKYGNAKLQPIYLFSLPGERPLEIARFVREHGIPFPAIVDSNQHLLKTLDGACSSEVYLFDSRGYLRYHGRVDDSTFDPKTVKSRDLENAIVAVSKGRPVAKPFVPAMGCAIPRI
jgi:cytochrome oxidase Cu insertion factor (SCO1/SenC/PrrC family)